MAATSSSSCSARRQQEVIVRIKPASALATRAVNAQEWELLFTHTEESESERAAAAMAMAAAALQGKVMALTPALRLNVKL